MDVMIVERSEQAKEIVGLMKKDRAGACTFFALDKLQPFREAQNLPGPRIVDEIWTEDERLKKAFYKGMVHFFHYFEGNLTILFPPRLIRL